MSEGRARNSYGYGWGSDFPTYVTAGARRAQAEKRTAALKKKGRDTSPVTIKGTKIASTFWGKAWCTHLESFSDYANRLPRGRSYVRAGAVVDLRIAAGKVTALVSGSELYTVSITIGRLLPARWKSIVSACTGKIASLVELLQGTLSSHVLEVVTHRDTGLFPAPKQIELDCSCPDAARMCKHVAATLYGVGARLDQDPALFFTLRGVDHASLVSAAIAAPTKKRAGRAKAIADDALGDIFGIDVATEPPPVPRANRSKAAPRAARPR